MGPLNEYKQYDYAIDSTWVRYPVFVIARAPERFRKLHMKNVLEFLQQNSMFHNPPIFESLYNRSFSDYINVMTKAFNMISPVDYEACQYTPTFSGTGK